MSHYVTLGVRENASEAAIKAAYRALAMQHHPDRNQGDLGAENRFKEVLLAYETVGDAARRRAYDESLIAIPPRPSEAYPFDQDEAGSRRAAEDEVLRDAFRDHLGETLRWQYRAATATRRGGDLEQSSLAGWFIWGSATVSSLVAVLLTGSLLFFALGFVAGFMVSTVCFSAAFIALERIKA